MSLLKSKRGLFSVRPRTRCEHLAKYQLGLATGATGSGGGRAHAAVPRASGLHANPATSPCHSADCVAQNCAHERKLLLQRSRPLCWPRLDQTARAAMGLLTATRKRLRRRPTEGLLADQHAPADFFPRPNKFNRRRANPPTGPDRRSERARVQQLLMITHAPLGSRAGGLVDHRTSPTDAGSSDCQSQSAGPSLPAAAAHPRPGSADHPQRANSAATRFELGARNQKGSTSAAAARASIRFRLPDRSHERREGCSAVRTLDAHSILTTFNFTDKAVIVYQL